MLSLENAASGTNLTEATHIFIIDPIKGDINEVQQIEAQAIGRVHRRGQQHPLVVIRMIMKDTIEHTIYNECYGKRETVPKLMRRQSFEGIDFGRSDNILSSEKMTDDPMESMEVEDTTPKTSPTSSPITSPLP